MTENRPRPVISSMNAIGYNGKNFFGGIQFVGDLYNVRTAKKLSINITKGNVKLILGYRFEKKKKSNHSKN